jgi:hypothetical protein
LVAVLGVDLATAAAAVPVVSFTLKILQSIPVNLQPSQLAVAVLEQLHRQLPVLE